MNVLATLVAVHLVSRVGGAGPADQAPKHALKDEPVELFAVLETDDGRFFSDAGELRLAGRRGTIRARPLAEGPRASLRWLKVEPTRENLSNTDGGRFSFHAIDYAETDLPAARDRGSLRADVRPTRIPDRGGGLGTMRFKVVAVADGVRRATPGAELRRGRGSGGLADAVHRVSLRRDDSYLGWLTELYGQPYIWASAGVSDRAHQAERLEGADCADFVTYGRRRLGFDVPYTWTEGLRRYTRRLGGGRPRADGVYVDERGRPLPFPRAGDLVLFPRHVGVLVEDRGTPGVLDHADVMAHTLFASPHEEAIGASGYGDRALEVMRWQ
jgi:hypothetical protein